jgi:Tfp pilus assembly protein PilW
VELMIALLLGVLLSSGIIAVYLESKRNFDAEEEMARIQENGRFAINLLKRELTLAGFYGGSFIVDDMTPPTSPAVSPDCATDWALDAEDPVEFINNFSGAALTQQGTTLNCLPTAVISSGTDVISIKRTAGEPTVKDGEWATGVTAAKQEQWYLKKVDYGETTEWVYVDDTGNFPSADTTAGSKVDYWEFRTNVFFIRDYSQAASDGIPTLCVARLVGQGMDTTDCLVEGVEDMQIEFGIDTDGDSVPNVYKAAPTVDLTATPPVNEMDDLVTARVYLLMRSLGEVRDYDNTNIYKLGSKSFNVDDSYLRRVFSTTVQTRNAILPALNN